MKFPSASELMARQMSDLALRAAWSEKGLRRALEQGFDAAARGKNRHFFVTRGSCGQLTLPEAVGEIQAMLQKDGATGYDVRVIDTGMTEVIRISWGGADDQGE